MSVTTIILITLAAIFALGFVFFKYFHGNNNIGVHTFVLSGLRYITLLTLLLLLINPGIKQLELEIEKPHLLIAVDASTSIRHFKKEDSVQLFVQMLENDPQLRKQFDIHTYAFGHDFVERSEKTINFNQSHTNIYEALKNLEKLQLTHSTALVLLTDGNHTLGEDYTYFKVADDTVLFPVVVGDTTAQTDLYISNLNVNRYAFLSNNFPVETIINYRGIKDISTRFEIRSANSILFTQEIVLNTEKNSEILTSYLPAEKLGETIYEAVVVPVSGEENQRNNSRKFVVEVVDERTTVLILSSILHPDLGALKRAIESNQQRAVTIDILENESNYILSDFQLLILYQPNNKFNNIFKEISTANLSSWIITGTQTDWDFLNGVQENFKRNATSQSQELFGSYNPNFSSFQFHDLNFEKFPPLEDRFGNLRFEGSSSSTVLYQHLEGVETKDPLLAVFAHDATKQAALFGENLWKWRAQSYLETGSFEEFDDFISSLVQFLANSKKKERLTLNNEPVYLQGENIIIEARYFDQNFIFNPKVQLEIELENSENQLKVEGVMLVTNNRYIFQINNLLPGEYIFTVKEMSSGEFKRGNFMVIENNIEKQFTSANFSGMANLAINNASTMHFLNDFQGLKRSLMAEDVFVSVQKSREKTLPLINWKILLFFLVFNLSAEWFMRKYFGLI